jgi:hypothetical protein
MTERKTQFKDGELLPLLVAASTTIEAGKLVAVNATGYAVEASDTAGLIVMGVADETVDNSNGANGAKTVTVRRKKAFRLANSGTSAVTQASVGSDVYVEDDETVALAGGTTNTISAGQCVQVETEGVWVNIG